MFEGRQISNYFESKKIDSPTNYQLLFATKKSLAFNCQ